MAIPSEELDQEIRELKREVIESRALVIKTNNLTNALSADLKSLGRRQGGQERRLVWTSATAYVVIVVVGLVASKVAIDARVDGAKAELDKEKALSQRQARELRDLAKRDEDRARAEAKAAGLYELVRAGRRAELVEQWEDVRKEALSKAEAAFFSDAVERARGELSVAAYFAGLDHARYGRWFEAQQAFEESLRLKDNGAHSAGARLRVAEAMRKLGKQKEAIPILQQLAEASADKDLLDDAQFLLAECLIDVQAWNDAKAALRQMIKRFPDSPLTTDARQLLAEISTKH